MTSSLWQIEFFHAAGSIRLLDYGDFLAEELAPEVTGPASQWSELSTPWGGSAAQAGATTALAWTVRRDHASHAAVRGFCMDHAAAFPTGLTGILRLSVEGGEEWDLPDVVLTRSTPRPLVTAPVPRSLTAYTATGGQLNPATLIDTFPGLPWIVLTEAAYLALSPPDPDTLYDLLP